MKIRYSDIYLNVNKPADYRKSSLNLIFLHGFTGSSYDWNDVLPQIDDRFNKITYDLLGHGKSEFPNDPSLYSWDLQVEQLNKIINSFNDDQVLLIGYSMGGRLALCYAFTYPERVLGMILESTSPGIRNKQQREKRIKDDDELSKFISTHTVEEFIELWLNKEIFGTLLRFSDAKRREIKKHKLKNNRIGLSNSLYGFSTGKMPYLYNQFKNLTPRTLLLTGDLDTKFTSLNKNISDMLPSAKHKIIRNSGHTIHFEEPVKFVNAVNDFLKEFI
jgi:2-succinyl-6-hydroxy-2,4-cyclohexadiene-1-carboxylate synthase